MLDVLDLLIDSRQKRNHLRGEVKLLALLGVLMGFFQELDYVVSDQNVVHFTQDVAELHHHTLLVFRVVLLDNRNIIKGSYLLNQDRVAVLAPRFLEMWVISENARLKFEIHLVVLFTLI